MRSDGEGLCTRLQLTFSVIDLGRRGARKDTRSEAEEGQN
jgi:hypothetical protein